MDNPVTLKEEVFITLLTALVGNPELARQLQNNHVTTSNAYHVETAADLTERAMRAMEKL